VGHHIGDPLADEREDEHDIHGSAPPPGGTGEDNHALSGVYNGLIDTYLRSEDPRRRQALLRICDDLLKLPGQDMELVLAYERLLIIAGHDPAREELLRLSAETESKLISQEIFLNSIRRARRAMPLLKRAWLSIRILLGAAFDEEAKAQADYLALSSELGSIDGRLYDERSAFRFARAAALEDQRENRGDPPRIEGFDAEAYFSLLSRALASSGIPGKEGLHAISSSARSDVDDLIARMGSSERLVRIPPLPAPGLELIETADPMDRDGGVLRILYEARRASSCAPDAGLSLKEYVDRVIRTPLDSQVAPLPEVLEDERALPEGGAMDSTPPPSFKHAYEALVGALTCDSTPPPAESASKFLGAEDIIDDDREGPVSMPDHHMRKSAEADSGVRIRLSSRPPVSSRAKSPFPAPSQDRAGPSTAPPASRKARIS